MRYTTKYREMKNAAVDFNVVGSKMHGYAQRLNNVKSTMDVSDKIGNFRNSIGTRAASIGNIASIANRVGQTYAGIRAAYLLGEQKAYQRTSGTYSYKISDTIVTGAVPVSSDVILNPKWISYFKGLFSNLIIGIVTSLRSFPTVNWGQLGSTLLTSLSGFVIGINTIPFYIPKPEPKPKPKPEPQPQPQPQPKPAPEPTKPTVPPGITEHDWAMRNEVERIRISYESRWRAASTVAEKKALLNELLAEVQRIQGTNLNTTINFHQMSAQGHIEPGPRTVCINEDWLNRAGNISLLKAVIHEARHGYQYEAAFLNNPNLPVSQETRKAWYESWRSMKEGDDYGTYYNRLIEVDARWFADDKY